MTTGATQLACRRPRRAAVDLRCRLSRASKRMRAGGAFITPSPRQRCRPPPAPRQRTASAVRAPRAGSPHAEPQTFCSPMSLSTTDSCGRAGHRCKAWPHEQGVDVAGPHPSPMPRRPPSPFPPLATRARTVAAPRHPPSLPSRRLGQAFTVCGEPAPAPARRGSPHARTRSTPIGTAQAPAVLTLLCHPLLAPMLAASTPDGSGGRSGASSTTECTTHAVLCSIGPRVAMHSCGPGATARPQGQCHRCARQFP